MRLRAILFASAVVLAATNASAQPPTADARARAKEAYDRGVEAHAKGDMQRAATEFARADSLAPSGVALQAALDAAIEADDPALGSELLERSKREKPSGQLAASIAQAKTKFSGRAGRVRVLCPVGSTCLATLDGTSIDTTKPAWSRTGQHTLVVQVDGEPQTKLVRVESNQVAEVSATKKDSASPAPVGADATTAPPDTGRHKKTLFEDGLPPVFFYGGVGLTVLLAGVTTYFAIDTSNTHDEFETLGCHRSNISTCQQLKDDGEGSQTATNVALVLTGLSAAGTAIVGAALTNWKSPTFGLAPMPGGGGVAMFARRF